LPRSKMAEDLIHRQTARDGRLSSRCPIAAPCPLSVGPVQTLNDHRRMFGER